MQPTSAGWTSGPSHREGFHRRKHDSALCTSWITVACWGGTLGSIHRESPTRAFTDQTPPTRCSPLAVSTRAIGRRKHDQSGDDRCPRAANNAPPPIRWRKLVVELRGIVFSPMIRRPRGGQRREGKGSPRQSGRRTCSSTPNSRAISDEIRRFGPIAFTSRSEAATDADRWDTRPPRR